MDRDKMMEIWRKYGKTYNVFVPKEQPAPRGESWDRPLPEPSKTGALDPQILKHWRLFSTTKNFLRHRYEEHGILRGPSLTFDCLVPKFQKPLDIPEEKRKRFKLPKNKDPDTWYAGVLEMVITSTGEVGFECHSMECLRTRCKLNRHNEKRISPVDLYSLIQIFHGYRSAAKAKQIVAEAFEVQIGKFEFKHVEKKALIKRYAIPNWAIQDLIQRSSNMKRQNMPRLVEEASDLIKTSQVVELEHDRVFSNYFAFLWPQIIDNEVLHKINGAAVRLYLWLLVRQQERAQRNEFAMRLTDAQIAREIGASKQTIGRYRQELEKLGLVRVKGDIWTVGYTFKSQWNR